MAPARILVTVEHSAGTGGVVREGGHAWLSLRVPQPVTRLDDHRPAVIGVDDRTLQGGLLPGGAVTAWATDDRGERHRAAAGNGAWAVVLAQPADGRPRPVCFRDAGGALVAPVLPASWARTPVLDAGEPCPACDSQQGWDEVVADDDSRGTRGFVQQPAPFVVCRACGHEHPVGVSYAMLESDGAKPSAEELARFEREADEHIRLKAQMAFADLDFEVFLARGRRCRRSFVSNASVRGRSARARGSRSGSTASRARRGGPRRAGDRGALAARRRCAGGRRDARVRSVLERGRAAWRQHARRDRARDRTRGRRADLGDGSPGGARLDLVAHTTSLGPRGGRT